MPWPLIIFFFQLFQMNLLKNIPLVSVGGQRGRLSLRQHSGHFHAQLDGTRAEKGFFGYQKLHRRQVGDGRRKRKIGKFFSKKKTSVLSIGLLARLGPLNPSSNNPPCYSREHYWHSQKNMSNEFRSWDCGCQATCLVGSKNSRLCDEAPSCRNHIHNWIFKGTSLRMVGEIPDVDD